jgi:hypothetical protein
MKGPWPIFLIILGIAVIGFGMMQQHRLETDLVRHDVTVAVPKEKAFTHYFIIGGVIAVAGVVGLALRGRS